MLGKSVMPGTVFILQIHFGFSKLVKSVNVLNTPSVPLPCIHVFPHAHHTVYR